jgi:3-hydroxyisobutyrate dehydrogenase-like beta-hydroxyacid dehydrogenase
MERIGFIGLGVMGKPMSKNLLRAGYELVIYCRNLATANELRQLGAEIANSPSEVASRTDVIELEIRKAEKGQASITAIALYLAVGIGETAGEDADEYPLVQFFICESLCWHC